MFSRVIKEIVIIPVDVDLKYILSQMDVYTQSMNSTISSKFQGKKKNFKENQTKL